jgi:transcriptional regulator with XRE-family HTH domain
MFTDFITRSGKSRSHWAERLGVSRSYLSDLLNGNRTPSLELAARIERMTGGEVPAVSWVPAPVTTPSGEDAA